MSALSKILRVGEGGRLGFWCPGCNEQHIIPTGEGSGPRWGYNGNPEKPTFTPSVLVRTGHHVPGSRSAKGDGCYCTWDKKDQADFADLKCTICHSFVTDGRIQFLGDCTHALAGQTVNLPEFPA